MIQRSEKMFGEISNEENEDAVQFDAVSEFG